MSTKELVVQMATAFFASLPLFRGNYSLYFAKIATAIAFLNSPHFYFSKYVKCQNCQKLHKGTFVVVVVVDILYCQYEQRSKLVDTTLV